MEEFRGGGRNSELDRDIILAVEFLMSMKWHKSAEL